MTTFIETSVHVYMSVFALFRKKPLSTFPCCKKIVFKVDIQNDSSYEYVFDPLYTHSTLSRASVSLAMHVDVIY